MTVKKRGLGRGLSDLLSDPAVATPTASEQTAKEAVAEIITASSTSGRLVDLPVEKIQGGQFQPRKDMDVSALEDLASSIRSHGILQPIVVREISPERYEIIAGERRWRAAQIADLSQVPAIIKTVSDENTMALALIENIQRENLNAVEEAMGVSRLIDEFSMTHQQVAEVLGKSRTTVTNLLRLLGLAAEVKTMLQHGEIEPGHAKVLLSLEGKTQVQAARIVANRKLSVRETEALVSKMQSPAKNLYNNKAIDPDVRNLQNNLSEKLGAAVKIQHTARGKGKLVIQYGSLEELDGILEHIK